MKKAMIDYMRNGANDEYYTPEEAVKPLLEYINPRWTVWEPTDRGESTITKMLKARGNKVITTHINQGVNFLTHEPEFDYDCIITNPPYSLKTEFLTRAYEMDKPFAFLLPITSLEGKVRGKLFKEHGVEVLVLNKRINFLKHKKGAWFNVSWFCRGILPKQLVFVEVS